MKLIVTYWWQRLLCDSIRLRYVMILVFVGMSSDNDSSINIMVN
jgi:hypothetical protein